MIRLEQNESGELLAPPCHACQCWRLVAIASSVSVSWPGDAHAPPGSDELAQLRGTLHQRDGELRGVIRGRLPGARGGRPFAAEVNGCARGSAAWSIRVLMKVDQCVYSTAVTLDVEPLGQGLRARGSARLEVGLDPGSAAELEIDLVFVQPDQD